MRVMAGATKTLYDTDFVDCTARTAELLREGRFDEVDWENLAEEIEDLDKSKRPAVGSQLHRMLKHPVKQRLQPEPGGASWRRSITEGRSEIPYKVGDSPSLRRHAGQNLQKIYRRAVRDARFETNLAGRAKEFEIPSRCLYTLDDLLEADLNASDSR